MLELVVGLGAFFYFLVAEGYPALLASLAGAALAMLAFSARRTLHGLLALRAEPEEASYLEPGLPDSEPTTPRAAPRNNRGADDH